MIISYKGIYSNEKVINDKDIPVFKDIVGEGTKFKIGIVENFYPKFIGKEDKKLYNLILISQFTCFDIEYLQYEELICNISKEEVDKLLEHREHIVKVTRNYYSYDDNGNKKIYHTQTMDWYYLHLERYIRNYMHDESYQKISVEKQKDCVIIEFGKYDDSLDDDIPF